MLPDQVAEKAILGINRHMLFASRKFPCYSPTPYLNLKPQKQYTGVCGMHWGLLIHVIADSREPSSFLQTNFLAADQLQRLKWSTSRLLESGQTVSKRKGSG
jgi:hypothetical protein